MDLDPDRIGDGQLAARRRYKEAVGRLGLVDWALAWLRAHPPPGTAAVWSRSRAELEPATGAIVVVARGDPGPPATLATLAPDWRADAAPPYGPMVVAALRRVLDGGG
jgi:hypothetical protein